MREPDRGLARLLQDLLRLLGPFVQVGHMASSLPIA
jgi:hypothetical protein